MMRSFIGAALALALAPMHAEAAARAHKAAPHRAAPVGLSIGKTPLPGHATASSRHKFGAVLPTGNCNPGFVSGQVPPAATWNTAIGCAFPKAGGLLGGPLGLPASTLATAPLNVAAGPTPTTPAEGDVWNDPTSGGFFLHTGGATIGPLGSGGGGGSVTSFQSSGAYLNVPSVTFTSANLALPAGTNVVLYNYGGYKIIFQLSTSGSSSVTQATADGVIQPGGTVEVAVGSNTNIAYATTTSGLTSSLQVVGGTGLWTGTQNNNLSTGLTGIAAPPYANGIGGMDNSSLLQSFGATAAGVGSTKGVMPIQGVASGVPVPISGSVTASFSQFAPNGNWSTPLVVGASSARTALPAGGGTTVAIYNTGANAAFVALGSASVAATASDDQVAPGGFLCFAVGSNVDIAAIETAGATTLNISGGSGGCAGSGGGGGSGSATAANQNATVAGTSATSAQGVQGVTGGVPMPTTVGNTVTVANPALATTGTAFPGSAAGMGVDGNGNIIALAQSGASVPINVSTAVTTQLVALASGKSIYVTSWDMIANGITNVTFEYGTGSLCGTGTTALTGPYGLVAQFGAAKGSGLGAVLVVPVGNALCVVNSQAVQVSGSLAYSQF